MIRWILHMQDRLSKENASQSASRTRNAMQGSGPSMAFVQETQDRPILNERPISPRAKQLPFGPRMMKDDMEPVRDHYEDLLQKRREFKEVEERGIVTNRAGGE